MLTFSDSLLSALPEQSRAKIERLDSDRAAAHDAVRSTSDRLQEARQDHGLDLARARERHAQSLAGGANLDQDYAAALGKLQEGPPVAGFLRAHTERQEQAVRMMQPVEAKRRVAERAQEAHDRAVERWQAYAFLEASARWLERIAGSGIQLRHAPLPAVKATVKAALGQEVGNLRKELSALDEAWRQAESAPATKADFRERAIQEIEALADKGAPGIDLRSRGPNPLNLAAHVSIDLQTVRFENEAVSRLIGDPSAFFAWLHRDALLARIVELIDAAPDAGALSYEQRETKFGEINKRRLELEFSEEAAIVAAANAGTHIPRRRDADPRSILEVQEA